MIKPIIPLAFYAEQVDIDQGLANSLPAGSSIFIVTSGVPTGKEYRSTGTTSPTEGSGAIKNNLAATTAPTVSNDGTQGYSAGSRWIDTVGEESYICLNATTGAAKWVVSTANTIGEIVNLQQTLDAKEPKVTGKGLSEVDFTTAKDTKLSGIATGATANDTDVNLKARANHIGTQAQSTVDNLTTDLGNKAATSHVHTGTYEPANTNIQTHVAQAHAPSTAEQNVNPDWNATSGDAQILNKPATDFTDWTSYTPVVSAESGAWSNYTATGRYRIVNRMLTVSFRVIFTGTSSSASGMYVSLPTGLTMNASVMTGGASWDTDLVGFGLLGDSGTISGVPAIITTRTNQKIIVKYYSWNGTYMTCPGFGNTTPWTWTTQDTIDGQFTVPIS